MYTRRRLTPKHIFAISWRPILGITLWSVIAISIHLSLRYLGYHLTLPIELVDMLGITVAFYLGFKNNQAYNRYWEARTIWGGIVNYSRSWANGVLTLLGATKNRSDRDVTDHARSLVYRHIAWLYALTHHLRRKGPSSPEYGNKYGKLYRGHVVDGTWETVLRPYLSPDEYHELLSYTNRPAQLLRMQGRHLRALGNDYLESYHFAELLRLLEEHYNLQGKCERIKNTPFPRQFAHLSESLVKLFCFLLPLGLLGSLQTSQFMDIALTIPVTIVVGWSFLMSETVGDLSEDPFENFIYDVSMSKLTSAIEVDLKEMLGESRLALPIKQRQFVAM